ncbi:MAG: NADH-quinone oxidoreductase subunit N [SAR202 cluster bacterium]|jgi:NADH-quinone oxidoreductase subunit N|nr:NADH-quinone oxidoreductase subunit N [SAR202 cluster bacterium]
MNDFTLLVPEFAVVGLAFGVLTADLFLHDRTKHFLAYVSVAGLGIIAAFSLIFLWNQDGSLYKGLLVIDGYSLFFKAFFLIIGVFAILGSVEYVRRNLDHPGEYYGIMLFTIVGMMLMAASGELLSAYISLELLSFGLYVLVAYNRYNPKSNEAGTKYILLGAFSSALLLYGISQIYGLTGTTRFDDINLALSTSSGISPGLLVGLVFIIAGMGFKVAAVPFHMWAPDVYEGAPTPVTAYLSVGSKTAAFALILRFFSEALLPAVEDWQIILIIIATLTMTLGNLVALAQSNIKRLLAYSSIGHVGYLIMGIAAIASINSSNEISTAYSHLAANGIILHLVAYAIATMAVFIVASALFNATGKEEITDFAGLARHSPLLALTMTASMFSLAGLPVFAGFTSKFYLFNAVASQRLLWLAGLAILTSLVSLYYYLRVIRQIYIEPPIEDRVIKVPRITLGVLSVLLASLIIVGIYPSPLMETVQHASNALFSSESVP